jgi:hypothetical protein
MDTTNPPLDVCHLLRFHIISARFDEPSEKWSTRCRLKVGHREAKTLAHPMTEKEVMWNESFIIEYDPSNKPTVEVQVFSKKDVLGKLEMKVNEFDTTDQLEWFKVQPTVAKLQCSGRTVGELIYRARHEFKLFGNLEVGLAGGQLVSSCEAKSVKAVIKHTTRVVETPNVPVKDGRFSYSHVTGSFPLDKNNNIFDVFIEIWENDPSQYIPQAAKEAAPTEPKPEHKVNPMERLRMIGQARLPLFDTRLHPYLTVPIHSVDHKQVGDLQINAKLDENKCSKNHA